MQFAISSIYGLSSSNKALKLLTIKHETKKNVSVNLQIYILMFLL